ncbi:hypothetical protein [Flavobacterium sp. 3HN19-14]
MSDNADKTRTMRQLILEEWLSLDGFAAYGNDKPGFRARQSPYKL